MSASLENHLWTHAKALRRLACCLVGESAADDLVQETALEALQLHRERPRALKAWLCAVLRNLAGKHRRGRRCRERHERQAPPPAEGMPPDRLAEQREIVRRLDAALLDLPEPYQGTLLRRFFGGSTPSEIAAETRAPLATVKSRLQRGLALLRERLQRDGADGDWWQALAVFGAPPAAIATAAAATATTGVVLMGTGTKLMFGAAAAVLAVATSLWIASGAPAPAVLPTPADAQVAVAPATASAGERNATAEPPAAATAAPDAQRVLLAGAAPADDEDAGDPPLRIRVVDANGRPVGDAPVGLRDGAQATAAVAWRGRTGADGIAESKRPRALLRGATGPVFATLLAPIRPLPAVPLDPAALPKEPVQLVLPATGSVLVWIDDLPPEQAEQVTVTLGAADAQSANEFMPVASQHPTAGRADFPFVGLGLSLLVRAQRSGQNDDTHVVVTGPAAPGGIVQVRLHVQPLPDRIVLVVHLLGADAQAFRRQKIDVAFTARGNGGSTTGTFDLDTDGDGTLRIAVEPAWRTMPDRSLRVRGRCGGPPEPPEACEAMVPLPPTLAPGENDLGTVHLLPPPLVCAGTVVSRDGALVADAELQVFARSVDARGRPREPEPVCGLQGRSDRDGRFVLRGSSPTNDLCLGVAAPGYLPAKVPFLFGSGNQRVELDAAASLAGSVRLDDRVAATDVVIELLGEHAETKRLQVRGRLGEFLFSSLPPGSASVRVRLVGEADGLLVADVPLRAGEVARDSRLQEIDLASGHRVVRFAVEDSEGRPVPDARVAVLGGADQRHFEGQVLVGGRGRIVTRAERLEVRAFADGYRAVRVDGLADNGTIVLPAALSVRVRLPDGCPVPAAPFALEIRMEAAGAGAAGPVSYRFFSGLNGEYSGDGEQLPWSGARAACFGADGEALVQLPEPGTWTVSWRLSVHQPRDRSEPWSPCVPRTIEVRDVPGAQTTTLGLGAEQLQAARTRLLSAR